MKDIAHYLDLLLYVMVALTIGLIFFKALELWLPGIIGQPMVQRLSGDAKSLAAGIERLEAGLPLLATIASASPFLGLAGTVMHIIEALRALSGSSVDITVISGPIATALNATLIGLASAVPATVAYNMMLRRLQVLENRRLRELA